MTRLSTRGAAAPEPSLSPADLDRLADAVAARVADRLSGRPRLVDRVDLAYVLGVSVPTVERHVRNGAIPCVRLGRRVLFDPGAVVVALSDPGAVVHNRQAFRQPQTKTKGDQ